MSMKKNRRISEILHNKYKKEEELKLQYFKALSEDRLNKFRPSSSSISPNDNSDANLKGEDHFTGSDGLDPQDNYFCLPVDSFDLTDPGNSSSELEFQSIAVELLQLFPPIRGFSIIGDIEKLLKPKEFDNPSSREKVANDPSSKSVEELASQLSSIFASNGVYKKTQDEILSAFHLICPSLKLPIRVGESGQVHCAFDESCPQPSGFLEYHACPEKDCFVFVGTRGQMLYKCPICSAERFTKCNQGICKSKDYLHCNHAMKSRVPRRVLFYRPILTAIKELLTSDLFLPALNFKYKKPAHMTHYIMDVLDGQNAVKNLKEMNEIYVEKCKQDPSVKLIHVPLLIGEEYDGIQLFKTRNHDFWPCFFTILNLPPNFRNRIGAGMFLLTQLSGSKASTSEDFLRRHCLVGELEALALGHVVEVGGVKYFVQVRCIMHLYDTKGLGKSLCCQEAGSIAGCVFCRHCGVYRDMLSRVIYPGHRVYLPMEHFLRQQGNSTQCCAPGFYTMNEVDYRASVCEKSERDSNSEFQKLCTFINNSYDNRVTVPRALNKKNIQSCDTILSEEFKSWYRDSDLAYVWYHDSPFRESGKFVKGLFKDPMTQTNYLWFENCDLRTQKDLTRRSNLQYLRDGVEAIKSGENVNGVSGLWVFAQLSYANIATDINYDPFHAVMGVCKAFLRILKGNRNVHCLQEYSAFINTHIPYLSSFTPGVGKKRAQSSDWTKLIPWTLTQTEMDEIDAYIDAILIPVSFSDQFQVSKVFQQTGALRGNEAIKVFTVLGDFIMEHILKGSSLPVQYKAFFCLFSSNINALFSKALTDEEIDQIHLRVLEMVCIMEGMFPDTEATFLMHELIHLAQYIKVFGPVHCWWTYGAERGMAMIKQFLPDGGINFDMTLFERYHAFERSKTNTLFNSIELIGVKISIDDSGVMTYDEYSFCLNRPQSAYEHKWVPSIYEWEQYFRALISIVEGYCDTQIQALTTSPFYRLIIAFRYQRQANVIPKDTTALAWLELIASLNEVPVVLKAYAMDTEPTATGPLEGLVYLSDMVVAKEVTQLFQLPIYKQALVYGVRITGRGSIFAESQPPVRFPDQAYGVQNPSMTVESACPISGTGGNPKNILETNWWRSEQYSSFGEIFKTTSFGKPPTSNNYHVQFNFFFKNDIPSDPVLHNVEMGNVLQRKRKPGNNSFVHIHGEADNSTVTNPISFVALRYVRPTPFLVVPMTEKKISKGSSSSSFPLEPIVVQNRNGVLPSIDSAKYVSSAGVSKVKLKELILLPLYPNSKDVLYKFFKE